MNNAPTTKQTIVTLIDDIDRSEAHETITFAYRGVTYSIDLNEKNSAQFDKAIRKYVEHGTHESTGRGSRRPAATGPSRRRADLAEIRAWAAENGHEIAQRGRGAVEVIAYDAEHSC